MTGRLHALGLGLGLVACQASGEPRGLAPLVERVAAADQRVATVQTRVDALTAKLDATTDSMKAVAALAEVHRAEDERREAERAAMQRRREQARRDLRTRLGLDGPPPPPPPRPAPTTEVAEPLVPPRASPRPRPGRPERRPSRRGRTELEGARESIWCDSPQEGWIRCGMDRSFFDYLTANAALLDRQARVIPHLRDGQHAGIKLYGMRRGSLPRLLGLENGDMITAFNREPHPSVEMVLALLAGPPGLTHFDLELERRGEPMIMTVDLVE